MTSKSVLHGLATKKPTQDPINNSGTNQSLGTQAWLQSTLARIEEQLVAGALEAQDASQCIASVIASTADIEGAAIALSQHGSLVCTSSAGLAPRIGSVLDSCSGLYAECISSGRMVWCQNATTDPRVGLQDGKLGFRSAIVLPLLSGGRIRGVLAAFSSTARKLDHRHITDLGTAAAMAGLLVVRVDPASDSAVDAPTEPVSQPPLSDPSRTPVDKQQALLAQLLESDRVVEKRSSRGRNVFLASGLGLLLLCGALFGVVRVKNSLSPDPHASARASQQPPTVSMNIGDPVPSDSVSSRNERIPRITGGNLRTRVNPVYPDIALRNGLEGDVTGVVAVDEAGVVNEVRTSSGDHELATAVASALGHWRYSPFCIDAHPVAVTIPFRVTFGSKLPLADRTRP
jgi:outer membrane biosynthesis protein TonB